NIPFRGTSLLTTLTLVDTAPTSPRRSYVAHQHFREIGIMTGRIGPANKNCMTTTEHHIIGGRSFALSMFSGFGTNSEPSQGRDGSMLYSRPCGGSLRAVTRNRPQIAALKEEWSNVDPG